MKKQKRSKKLNGMSVKEYHELERKTVEASGREYSKLEVYFVYE